MNTFTFIGLIFVVLGFLLVFPFLILWSLNTLFTLGLQYTWTNWIAIFIMWTVFASRFAK